MTYPELVTEIKHYYSLAPNGVRGGVYSKKSGKEEFRLKWCPQCEEINLWTYWQGYENPDKKAEVLVLGQDWATPWKDKTNTELLDYVQRIRQSNTGCSERYIEEIRAGSSPTDVMLRELMLELGKEYDPFKPNNPKLFFANLCLGYRNFGSSGGMDNSAIEHDVKYIEELIHIVQPKVVICLGKAAYDAFVKNAEDIEVMGSGSFYDQLSTQTCYSKYKKNTLIFGVGHPGKLGCINRKKYDTSESSKKETAVSLMKADWRHIRERAQLGETFE